MIGQLVVNGLLMGSVFALIASGLAFIYGPLNLVNFAHGDLLMIAMYIAFLSADRLHVNILLALPITFLVMGVIGLLDYRFLVRPVLQAPRLAQALTTHGFGVGLQALALFFMGPDFRMISNVTFRGTLSVANLNVGMARLMAGLAGAVSFALLFVFLKYSKTGKAVQAIAMNREAASLIGIDLERMYALSLVISMLCTGVAGVFLSQFYYIFPVVGPPLLSMAWVAMVIGGFGSMPGAFIGGLIVGLTQALGGFFMNPALKDAIMYVIFVGLMAFKPRGLFGW
jgi:branched-chain amino acid transport system permease protein